MVDLNNAVENVEQFEVTKKEIYQIHESFMEELEKKLKRIQKKCQKYGNEFTYEVLGFEMLDIETDKNKEPNYQKFFNIKAVGTALINNWEFIAVLEPYGNENVIRRYNTEVELPIRFRESKNVCEHCNTERNRKELFVIRNIETNEFKQVGRSCLKDYTNGLSAENVASHMEWMDFLKEYEESEYESISGGVRKYFNITEILQYALICTEKFGFFRTESVLPTAERVRKLVFDLDKTLYKWYIEENINLRSDDIFNDDTERKAQEIMQYYLNQDDSSEFIHNVQVIIKGEYCRSKEFGLLACLPNCYRNAIEKERMIAERKAEIEKVKDIEKESNYFGEVGKRYTVDNMNIIYVSSYDTEYGTMRIYKLIDKDNHVFVWKTSTWLELEERKYKVTFTIKNHSEYNDIMQTEVSRCKLV